MDISIEADDVESLVGALKSITFDVLRADNNEDNLSPNVLSGGVSSNYTIQSKVDKDMNHEKYMELVDKFLQQSN